MKEILKRIFLWDLVKGMMLTFRYQAPKNVVTEQYPQERPMMAERYRGAPRLNMNPGDGRIALYFVQSVRAGVPGKSDCGGMAAR
jgi:formate hydrogenlyase subunit 6/NADH:ubiquinone oxidoreductase subunit I